MAGLGLQSAFGGAALDQALQKIVADQRLKELQDQETARQNAELELRKQQVAATTSAEQRAQDKAKVDYSILKGQMNAEQPAAGPGEGGSMLSGPIPQGVPVSQPSMIKGLKGIPPVTGIQSNGPQPTVNPFEHPTVTLPDAFGQQGGTFRVRTPQESAEAQTAAELAKPTTLGKDQIQVSGGKVTARGVGETPEYKDEFVNIGGKNVRVKTDTKTGLSYNPDTGAPIQSSQMAPEMKPRDPLLEQLTAAQLKALNDKNKVDPNAVAFWGQQVLKDPANMGLVKNKAMQDAVTTWIADNGGNVDRLTQADKQMRELATNVLPHVDTIRNEANELADKGLLGPIASRWRDFMAGTIGAGELAGGNAENAKLIGKFQTDVGLLATAVGRVHGGARGGGSPVMLEHLKNLVNAGAADLPTFQGHLDSFHDWLTGYAGMTSGGTTQAPTSGSGISVVRDATGNLVIKR